MRQELDLMRHCYPHQRSLLSRLTMWQNNQFECSILVVNKSIFISSASVLFLCAICLIKKGFFSLNIWCFTEIDPLSYFTLPCSKISADLVANIVGTQSKCRSILILFRLIKIYKIQTIGDLHHFCQICMIAEVKDVKRKKIVKLLLQWDCWAQSWWKITVRLSTSLFLHVLLHQTWKNMGNRQM